VVLFLLPSQPIFPFQLPNCYLNVPHSFRQHVAIPDVLITDQEVFTWYCSQGRKGYSASLNVPVSADEEETPAVVFADQTQSIFLADMCGDGLTDIVRIQNGSVCYWSNLD